ncbi:MAG: GxxExxY protein [Candidatus Omnitrophota bacterium]
MVLVELKATKGVTKIDEAQVHNYLKATQNG